MSDEDNKVVSEKKVKHSESGGSQRDSYDDRGGGGYRERRSYDKRESNRYGGDSRSGGGRDNWRSGGGGGGGGGERAAGRYNETMDIAGEDIGKIIGRAGSNVKEIQSKFSVNVKVNRGEGYSQEGSTVFVSGDDQQDVNDAIAHIRDQIRNGDSGGGRRGGGGDYGRSGRGGGGGGYGERKSYGGGGGSYGRSDNRNDF